MPEALALFFIFARTDAETSAITATLLSSISRFFYPQRLGIRHERISVPTFWYFEYTSGFNHNQKICQHRCVYYRPNIYHGIMTIVNITDLNFAPSKTLWFCTECGCDVWGGEIKHCTERVSKTGMKTPVDVQKASTGAVSYWLAAYTCVHVASISASVERHPCHPSAYRSLPRRSCTVHFL